MNNIWEYEYCGKEKLVDKDGNEFVGEAQEVTDESERADDEKQEEYLLMDDCGSVSIEDYTT